MKIGFIGLGNMGAPMAVNLVEAGFEVTGFDISNVDIPGVIKVNAVEAAVNQADAVVTMLPNGEILQQVTRDILPYMTDNTLFLDCSTVDVDAARVVSEMFAKVNVSALDAPVSGGINGAIAGTLTFMIGGELAAFEKAKPLFKVMGQKAVYCGTSGAGQAAKICNNMILGITMIGTCEAFVLADKLGLDRQKLFDVVSTSSGSSWSMNAYCPAPGVGPSSPADNDYQPGFAAELMLKDLRLAQHAAASTNTVTLLGEAARDIYKIFIEHQDGKGRDFSAILPYLQTLNRKT